MDERWHGPLRREEQESIDDICGDHRSTEWVLEAVITVAEQAVSARLAGAERDMVGRTVAAGESRTFAMILDRYGREIIRQRPDAGHALLQRIAAMGLPVPPHLAAEYDLTASARFEA